MLRPVVEDDWELRYKWLVDPEVSATLSSGAGMPLTPAEVKERTAKYAKRNADSAYFTVMELESSENIGSAQLFGINHWARSAELGLWIGEKSSRGKGYGTDIVHTLLGFAFHRLNLHKIMLTVDEDNPGAMRCYEKCGFRRDGILRDEVYKNGRYCNRLLMSILDQEFDERS